MDRGYDTRSPIQKKSSLPRTFALFRGFIFFTALLFLIGTFIVVAYAPLFAIRTVYVVGSVITPSENIQTYVAKVLEGNWRTVVPFDTVIGVPTETIEKGILKSFPSVESVKVTRKNFSGVEVLVSEKIPTSSFCEGRACVLLDNKGILFALSNGSEYMAIEGSPAEFARRSASTTQDTLTLGSQLLSQERRYSLEKVNSFLASKNFVIKKITLQPLGFFDVSVTLPAMSSSVEFRFRDNKKLDQQIQELYLALEKGLYEKIMQNKVEYVISYVPQKVIYKNTELQN